MKKIVALTGVLAMMLFASCKDKKQDTPPATPPPAESPAPPPAPEPQVEDEDGTSIKLNEDGVSVKNKDGENESNVTVTDDKKELEINTD
ncbi:hypothetical protein GCM10007424_08970 [Flavobacterium suaedae]|uniref:Uncharacterized protein n=1 Tax=Flavobacterium suaedae TaxID=1767027 RepID=A0ABQ1JNK5_9FLAO|nr:hypothetical protein [Flavobacterium suaedae]GGB71166.1 hypothetical protein GCM10007424_08970 [Flavobacterium suaedae]